MRAHVSVRLQSAKTENTVTCKLKTAMAPMGKIKSMMLNVQMRSDVVMTRLMIIVVEPLKMKKQLHPFHMYALHRAATTYNRCYS